MQARLWAHGHVYPPTGACQCEGNYVFDPNIGQFGECANLDGFMINSTINVNVQKLVEK